jgi:hypothetical protein
VTTPSQVLQRAADDLDGVAATDSDIQILRSHLPDNLTPDWLASLLREHKLAEAYFSLSADDDQSGLGADVIWLTARQMASEACEAEPGISVHPLGFLPIGACATGSGDPYFLDLRQGSNDPPVVRIPHDFAGGDSYPLDRIELVAESLSAFFGKGLTRK